jgi:general secretion pathway protein A
MLYLPYYNLQEKPFADTANPKYFWPGEGQSEAIAIINYGIEKGHGITVLTGDVGSGKTVLANYLAGHLKNKFEIAQIDDSDIESLGFLHVLANSLNLQNKFEDKRSFFEYIDGEYSKTQKGMLIFIDEAHRTPKTLLNDLNLMAKIKRDHKQLINIILVGQSPIIELVKEIKPNGQRQKDTIVCHLRPLTKSETSEYIIHRLKIAGTEIKLFSSGAIGRIFQYSGGIPRIINTICDHALMIGYSTDLKKVRTSVIKKCIEDLKIQNNVIDTRQHWTKETSGGKNLTQAYQRTKQKLLNWTS